MTSSSILRALSPVSRSVCPLAPAVGLPSLVRRKFATATAATTTIPQPQYDIPIPPSLTPKVHRPNLKSAKPFSDFLTDSYNRQHDYLRISITERCNLRCTYCMPAEGVPLSPKEHLLTPPEILYISSLFVSQGVTKIRLTGGEPTVHPQILPLMKSIGALRSKGLRELAITTNGLTLARKIDTMIEAGVTGVNLSLDTLDPFQFEIMTRRRGFDQVMKSINRILDAKRAGAQLKLKINAVVIRGLNDAQILPFVEMTRDQDIEVRFIEYMPFDGNRWSKQKMLTYREMVEKIQGQHPGFAQIQGHPNDTSKTYQVPGFVGKVGFITSMTEHFCGSCNRLRITTDGNLKVCLFGNAEVSLRDLLRKNFNNGEPIDEAAWEAMKQVEMDRYEGRIEGLLGLQEKEQELLNVIGMAVKRKKEKHAGIGELEHMKNRPMILIDYVSACIAQLEARDFTEVHVRNVEEGGSHYPLSAPFRRPREDSVGAVTTDIDELLDQHDRHTQTKGRFGNSQHRLRSGTSYKPQLAVPLHLLTSTSSTTHHPRFFCTTKRRQTSPQKSKDAHLTHLAPSGAARMVSLPPPTPPTTSTTSPSNPPATTISSASASHKPPTTRAAIARALIRFSNATPARLIRSAALKKGDVLSVARIAGIMAAKRTADLIPLCHNISIGGVGVDVEVVGGEGAESTTVEEGGEGDEGPASVSSAWKKEDPGEFGGVVITARVHTFGQTGVEMEALTAASVAGLTVYDMCKAVDKGMVMEAVRVVLKEGGRSGDWRER